MKKIEMKFIVFHVEAKNFFPFSIFISHSPQALVAFSKLKVIYWKFLELGEAMVVVMVAAVRRR